MRKPLFLVLLFVSKLLCAQKPDPVNGRWTYFPYAVGERTDKKLKVLIIGTHLIRFNSLVNASNVNVEMSLDFGKIVDQIQQDERYHPADYDNIGFLSPVIEDLQGDYLKWHPEVIRTNNLSSSDNTLSAMEKIRTTLIDSYKAKGYKVYQVNFNLNAKDWYKYYDAATSTYKNIDYERLAPLSPLYVRVYQRGEIKDLLSRISRDGGSSSGGGLVIESKDDKKKSAVSNNNSGGGSHKMTDEEIRIDISYRKTLAESDAAEGDRLYKLGTMFYPAALEKYKAAQARYYSPDVQRRVDELSSWVALGQLMNDGIKAADNLAENVDPNKKTRWCYWGFSYGGFGGNYSKITNGAKHEPMEGLLTLTGHRLFLSFEMRTGYYASPVYEYIVTTTSNGSTPYTVQTQNGAIGLGLSGGINIPMKSLVVYAMIGFDARMFNVSKKITPSQFSFDESEFSADFPGWENRTTFGATYKIPKSRVSFSLQYTMHSIKGEDNGASPIKFSGNASGKYYLNRTTNEKYEFTYFNAGIAFAF